MPKNVKALTETGIVAGLVQKSKRHTRAPAGVDLGFSEFRVQGISQNLWPDGLVNFKGNVSLDPQVEIFDSRTIISANPSGGAKTIDCYDQYGAIYGTIELVIYALTDVAGTAFRTSTLEVWRGSLSGGGPGTSGSVPFDTVSTVDGTYFTTQTNGGGTSYSPIIHKPGLYVVRLWVSP